MSLAFFVFTLDTSEEDPTPAALEETHSVDKNFFFDSVNFYHIIRDLLVTLLLSVIVQIPPLPFEFIYMWYLPLYKKLYYFGFERLPDSGGHQFSGVHVENCKAASCCEVSDQRENLVWAHLTINLVREHSSGCGCYFVFCILYFVFCILYFVFCIFCILLTTIGQLLG